MTPVFLSGVSGYLPGKRISNEEIATICGLDADWIDMFVGTKSRHLAIDFERMKPSETLAQMGAKAARSAMEASGVVPGELDFILLSTATPDQLMPATVNQIADLLGMNKIASYQIQCGCVGAVQAINLAHHLVRSGAFTKGLVMGGDIGTKFARPKEAFLKLSPAELINYALFGDGAGAAIVSSTPLKQSYELLDCRVRFEGLGAAPGQEMYWYGPDRELIADEQYAMREDYKAIQARVPQMTEEVIQEVMDALAWRPDDVSYFLLPQLSGNMSKHLVKTLSMPESKTVDCVTVTGNTGNALPFLQMSFLNDSVQSGQTALAVAIESSKWLKGSMALRRC